MSSVSGGLDGIDVEALAQAYRKCEALGSHASIVT